MTEAAQRFVTPLTFQSVTGRAVYTDLWQSAPGGDLPTHVAHVGLAEGADLLVIAPATAQHARAAGARLRRRPAGDHGAGGALPAAGRPGDGRRHVRPPGDAGQPRHAARARRRHPAAGSRALRVGAGRSGTAAGNADAARRDPACCSVGTASSKGGVWSSRRAARASRSTRCATSPTDPAASRVMRWRRRRSTRARRSR